MESSCRQVTSPDRSAVRVLFSHCPTIVSATTATIASSSSSSRFPLLASTHTLFPSFPLSLSPSLSLSLSLSPSLSNGCVTRFALSFCLCHWRRRLAKESAAMGNCSSAQTAVDPEAKKASDRINQMLKEEKKNAKIKLLLLGKRRTMIAHRNRRRSSISARCCDHWPLTIASLGTGESGKSTFAKQMRVSTVVLGD